MVKRNVVIILLNIYLSALQLIGPADGTEMNLFEKSYCNMSEFTELNYYLFCNTTLSIDGVNWEYKSVIIDDETENIEEAEELHNEFLDSLSLTEDEKEGTFVRYISPDSQWVITNRWNGSTAIEGTVRKEVLFFQKKRMKETSAKVSGSAVIEGADPIIIVRNGDAYGEMEAELQSKYMEMNHARFQEGYYDELFLNEKGTLAAGIIDESQLIIRKVEDKEVLWNLSLEEIQDAVERIRLEERNHDKSIKSIVQFKGNEREGRVIVQGGRSSFFEIAYPSNEVTYLGEYLYSLCYSPDGKYAAYSSVDYDNGVDMEPEEADRIAPGIYVVEIETGKIAYIYWDPGNLPQNRHYVQRYFMWVEKQGHGR